LAWNDDDPDGGLDARIDHRLPASGGYVIRAQTYGAGQRGNYTLEVTLTP